MSGRLTDAQRLLRAETEAAFATWVIDAAHLFGYRVAHFRPAMTNRGWRTPVQGDGAGFPDLVLVHPEGGRGIAAELKREVGGIVRKEQQEWLQAFAAAGFVAEVWRPSMRAEILTILRERAPRRVTA